MKRILFILSLLVVLLTASAQQPVADSCHELIITQRNGQSIYGILSSPTPHSSQGKHGVVIISHGFNGTHHFGRDYFHTLNDLGYAVYTFDFPCGSINSRSNSNTMQMSILDERQALKEIVAYFRRQPDVDRSKIVLCGESQGGLVSALTAAELQKQVSRLVLIYPALCIPDNWNERYPADAEIPDTTLMWNVPLGKRFFTECRAIDVYSIIGRYRGPVLIIHGSADPVVPLSYSQRAVSTYRHASLKVIDKAGHGFKPQERELSNSYVREFLSCTRVSARLTD